MATTRHAPSVTRLSSGKVLVAGGSNVLGIATPTILGSAEVYDPANGTFAATGSMAQPRIQHTATLLPSGLVLVAGGEKSGSVHASAELYDPATGTFTATGSMAAVRTRHGAVLLASGKVLVAGGYGMGGVQASAELYDPSTDAWSSAGSMSTARSYIKLALLPSGKVLASGGYNSGILATAEVYDPATNTWSPTGSMAAARLNHTLTPLPSGKVLAAGGQNPSYNPVTSAELYDPDTGLWSATQAMSLARTDHTATVLSSGKVLVTGGNASAGSELYDPATGTWQSAGRMVQGRSSQATVLLASGKALTVGGSAYNSLASAELFTEELPPPEQCETLPPTIAMNGSAEMTLECQQGGVYTDPGAQAFDGCDNPIQVYAYNTGADSSGPGPLLQYEGVYSVPYATWNSAGSANATRTVTVADRTAPTLTRNGPAHMVHTCNTGNWTDPGVTVADACYGNIGYSVVRSGEVNAWAEGTYTLTYSLTDPAGNSSVPVTRTVEVVDCPW